MYQQTQRWIAAGYFTALVDDLCLLLREAKGHNRHPSATILNSRTLQSTQWSGGHAGYNGTKRRKGSKVHVAVDTLSHLLTLLVTPANEQDWVQISELAQTIQGVTGSHVEITFEDQGYNGDAPIQAAQDQGFRLEVVKLLETKRGFVLLPRLWVGGHSFARATRFRRLVRDYEQLPGALAGSHVVVFACLMLYQ